MRSYNEGVKWSKSIYSEYTSWNFFFAKSNDEKIYAFLKDNLSSFYLYSKDNGISWEERYSAPIKIKDAVYSSDAGRMYIASDEGIYYMNNDEFFYKIIDDIIDINSIDLYDDIVVFSNKNSIYLKNNSDQSLKIYSSKGEVSNLSIDMDGRVFFIEKVDEKSKAACIHIPTFDFFYLDYSAEVYNLSADKNSNRVIFDTSAGIMISDTNDLNEVKIFRNSLSNGSVNSFKFNENGTIYISTKSQGIYIIK